MMATSTSVKSDIYTTALVIYFCLQISQAGELLTSTAVAADRDCSTNFVCFA